MTTKDLRKYAEEKGFPKRFTDDIVQRIESDTGEDIDEMSFYELCAYIDRSAEYWSGFRKFLEYQRKERAERRKERAERQKAGE